MTDQIISAAIALVFGVLGGLLSRRLPKRPVRFVNDDWSRDERLRELRQHHSRSRELQPGLPNIQASSAAINPFVPDSASSSEAPPRGGSSRADATTTVGAGGGAGGGSGFGSKKSST